MTHRWCALGEVMVSLMRAVSGCALLMAGMVLTVAVSAASGERFHAETTLPEERLAEQLLAGDVAAARGEFDQLLAAQMARLEEVSTQPVDSTTALARRANTLRRAVMMLQTWQGAELEMRRRGQGAPATTVERMVGTLDAMDAHAKEIERLRGSVPAPPSEDHRTRDIRAVGEDVGRLLLRSTAFVHGTSAEHRRSQLLDAARHWVATPATVREFDSRFGADPQKAFNLRPVPSRPRPIRPRTQAVAPSSVEERRQLGEADAPLLDLARQYAEAVIAGDMAALQRLYAPGVAAPVADPRESGTQWVGWEVANVGAVFARDLPGGRTEVALEDLELRGPGGERRSTRAVFVVAPSVGGGYAIVAPQGAGP